MRISSVALTLALAGCGGASPSPRAPSLDLDVVGVVRVLVVPESHCPTGHHCDILEVVDIHTRAASQDKGFDAFRMLPTGTQRKVEKWTVMASVRGWP